MRQKHPPAGPATTFEDLYAEHAERVLSLLWLFGVAEDERQDASQEVWTDVHRSLPLFDPRKGSARAWIAGIARNAARDWRRTRKRRPEHSTHTDKEPSTTHTAEAEVMEAQRREALWSYYERALPNEEQRDAFLLHVIQEMTIEEVAETTGAQPCTVRWRIAMARRRLKEEMTEEERRKLLAILPVMSVDAFVHALRDTKFPDREIAQVWDRVTARIEAEGGSIHDPLGTPEAAPSPAAPKGYTFTGPSLASAFAGVFLLGVVSGVAAHALFSSSSKGKMTTIEAEIQPAPWPTTEAPPKPIPMESAAPSMTSSPAPSSGAWESEAGLLDRARTAEPAEALALADRHARRFPTSHRAAAREEIAIRALVQLGRHAEAEERAARLLQWAPAKRPAMETLFGRSFL